MGATADIGNHVATSTGQYLMRPEESIVYAIDRRVPLLTGAVQHFCVADGTGMPCLDGSFDLVMCVSVLEHAGLTAYGQYADQPADLCLFSEMLRVLREGGRLLLTVPFGADYIHDEWIRSYSRTRLKALISFAASRGYPAHEAETAYFRNSCNGWSHSSAEDLIHTRQYSDPASDISGLYCGEFMRLPRGGSGTRDGTSWPRELR